MIKAVDDIPTGEFVGEVKEVDCACRVRYIDDDVADLSKTVRSAVHPKQL